MTKNEIANNYFEWLISFVNGDGYRKLLMALHDTEFIYSISMDGNRAQDGIDLRLRYIDQCSYHPGQVKYKLCNPCSVLEMMVALAIRCDETIMTDPDVDSRIDEWFWKMIDSLGLGDMSDDNFNRRYVNEVIKDFLNHNYDKNGRGGLFTMPDDTIPMNEIEIWIQMCWYLDTIL